uniref:Uncharacterized protein n=1 Tax=Arundo donax TaxID=35708 RepID=A0A0A9H8E2_ARUDO
MNNHQQKEPKRLAACVIDMTNLFVLYLFRYFIISSMVDS